MNEEHSQAFWPEGGEALISVDFAFDAVREFVLAYWRLRGLPYNETSDLVAFMERLADGGPADPAMWADWLTAIAKARAALAD